MKTNGKRKQDILLDHIESLTRTGIWEMDLKDQTIEWSDGIYRMLGYKKGELGNSFHDGELLIHPEDREASKEYLFKAIENQSEYNIRKRLICKNGQIIHVLSRASIIRDENNNPIKITGIFQDISELHELQQMLDNASKMSKIGAWEVDIINNEHYWSSVTCEIFGVPHHFKPDFDKAFGFYHPDFRPQVQKVVDDAVKSGDPFEFEAVIIKLNGEHTWVKAIGQAEFSDGTCVRIFGSIQDIQDRKDLEIGLQYRGDLLHAHSFVIGQLLQNDDWYTVLGNTFPVIGSALKSDRLYYFKIHKDYKTGIKLISQHFEWVNEGIESFINDPDLKNVPYDEFTYFLEPLEKMSHYTGLTKNVPKSEFKNILERQSVKSLLVAPIFENGSFSGFIGVDDCSNEREWTSIEIDFLKGIALNLGSAAERFLAKNELRDSLNRFETITRATYDAIWDFNVETGQLFWGSGFKTLFGYDPKEIMPSYEFMISKVHPEDRDRFITESRKYLSEHTQTDIWNMDYRFLKSDGNYAYVSDRAIFVRDEAGRVVRAMGAMTDITHRKQSEESLKQLNEELAKNVHELALSNQELEQFAYIASHDLQEPLRMISGFMNQLEKKYSDVLDEKAHQYIHFAVDGAQRMKQIINDLLEYSRVGRDNESLQWINMSALVEEAISLNMGMVNKKKARISAPDMPVVYTYKAPISRLFQNLINNSLKYSRPGVPPEIRIQYNDTESHHQFSLTDNGIGIAEQYHEKIFIIFQRLHGRSEYSGTGIGLAIVKKIVENLGGRIWVESTVDEGTTIHFTIKKIRPRE